MQICQFFKREASLSLYGAQNYKTVNPSMLVGLDSFFHMACQRPNYIIICSVTNTIYNNIYMQFLSIPGTPVSIHRPMAQEIYKSPLLIFENSNSFYSSLSNKVLESSEEFSPAGVFPLLVNW